MLLFIYEHYVIGTITCGAEYGRDATADKHMTLKLPAYCAHPLLLWLPPFHTHK